MNRISTILLHALNSIKRLPMKLFFYRIARLSKYFREGGVTKYLKKNKSEEFDVLEAYKYTNDALKKVQTKTYKLLKQYYKTEKAISNQIKTLKSKKSDKRIINKIEYKLKLLNYRVSVLEHLMDSMVWTILGGKRELVARFYMEDKGRKSIEDKGFEATLGYCNKLNIDRNTFALITDLTTNIQVGDLIITNSKGFSIIEVKTGSKNLEAIELFKSYDENKLDVETEISNIPDPKFRKQMNRMLNQKKRIYKTRNILINETGPYQKGDNGNVNLIDPKFAQRTYHESILKLLEKSEKENFAYDFIGNIIHVGVYRKHWRFGLGLKTLRELNSNYPVYDLRNAMSIAVCEPIFCKPFPQKYINQIISGEVIIYIGVDYQKIIDFANDFGGTYRWSTRREFQLVKDHSPISYKETLNWDNRGITFTENDKMGFVGMGQIFRMVFDHYHPWDLIINRINHDSEEE